MITIPDNPTLEWAEEQADKLVLAQWAIFKELSELALLSDKLQLAELEIFAVYLISGRRSYPKKPGDWPGDHGQASQGADRRTEQRRGAHPL